MAIPTVINGHPVLAALPMGPTRWAVVCERKRTGTGQNFSHVLTRFVVWSVESSDNALGGWYAENGRYDLTFGHALNVMADRAGYVPKG